MAQSGSSSSGSAPRKKRTARVYIHEGCGGSTEVSGHDFKRLANPTDMVGQTYCAACAQFVDLDQVAWADTGEVILEYRKRLSADVPWISILLPFIPVVPIGLICLLVAWLLGSAKELLIVVGLGGAALGFGLGFGLQKVYYDVDYRQID